MTPTPFRRLSQVTLMGAALIMLSACADVRDSWIGDTHAWVPAGKRATVSEVQYRHMVDFEPGSDRLSVGERRRLAAFVKRIDQQAGDRSFVGLPASSDLISRRRRDGVISYLNTLGLKPLAAEGYGFEADGGHHVGVFVRQVLAVLPGCPDWTGKPGSNFNNLPSANWSCAVESNFAAMLARPADMARGRDPGPAMGEHAALAITRYRKGETTPLPSSEGVDTAAGASADQGAAK